MLNSSEAPPSNNFVLYSAEYSEAYRQFVQQVLYGFAALDPLLKNVPIHTTEHSGPTIYPQAQQPLEQPMEEAQIIGGFNIDLRCPDIEAHTEGLMNLAEDYRNSLLKRMLGVISEVCDAHGNVVNAVGKPVTWDIMLDMLDGVEVSFDDQGKMNWPQIVAAPETSEQLHKLLTETSPTPEQERRLEEIQLRKKQTFDARNRPRRLSRLSI